MEQKVCCSFQPIRDEPYVLFRKQQNTMNQIKEMKTAKEAHWKCEVAELKAERDVIKMERDVLKTKEIEKKTELHSLLIKIVRLKRNMMNVISNILISLFG
ncbi:hypothetical protein NPIL_652491 [Nephila pilipes]|uniref:Uncharacterized protein n=1 Tax=Nephila pilipes TaxID=299642 RepID=A0A8X6R082_NEPPI|nr:hypothetical protein NPIL_652491 [Nephila pilipes]